jgi:Undecaprenyl-phosphate glucose phosphotransferase
MSMTLRLNSYRFYIRLWCYILPLVAFLTAAYIRFGVLRSTLTNKDYDPHFYFAVLLLTTLVWVIAAESYRLCDIEELFQEHTGVKKAVSACATTYVVLLCVLFFYRQQNFSRVFFAVSAVILLVGTVLTRMAFRMLLRVRRRRRPLRILVVGADDYARQLATKLGNIPFAASRVVAHLRIPGQEVAVKDLPVFELDDVEHGIDVRFDDVVIALPAQRLPMLSTLFHSLEPLCAPVRAIIDIGDVPLLRERLFQFGDLQMLDLANTPAESPMYFVLKRGFDVVFSMIIVCVLGPLMAGIATLIKLTSSGPILFRQERVGLNGQHFTMYKFRTMTVSAPSESETRWTTQNDPRCTMIGKFLRRTSLDELPQFFNVLKGEMSVVGPRPERPHFVKIFLEQISHYDTRHRLKVGITGWAQVNGWRGDTSIPKRVEYDRYYLQNWSFWLDIQIVCLTAWTSLFGKNAY